MCDKRTCRDQRIIIEKTAVNKTSRAASSGARTSRAVDDSKNTDRALNDNIDTTGTLGNKKNTDRTVDNNNITAEARNDSIHTAETLNNNENTDVSPDDNKNTTGALNYNKNATGTLNDNTNTARPLNQNKNLTVAFDSHVNVSEDVKTESSTPTRNHEIPPTTPNETATVDNKNRTMSATDDESIRAIMMLHLNVAEALIEMLPERERSLPSAWLEIIEREGDSSGTPLLEEAAQYARYLSLALATGVFREAPFHQSPPSSIGDAPTLTSDLWSSVIASCSLDVTWAREIVSNSSKSAAEPVSPKDFFKSQPTPPCGAICYMAAISDMPLF